MKPKVQNELKINLLHSHIYVSENVGVSTEEKGERLQQNVSDIYQETVQ